MAQSQQHRFGVVLSGDLDWQKRTVVEFIENHFPRYPLKIGGEPWASCESISFIQGRQKLGQETDLLVVDLSGKFDADGFAAVTGTLKGGSLLLFINRKQEKFPSQVWLSRGLAQWPTLDQHTGLNGEPFTKYTDSGLDRFGQQKQAIAAVKKVLTGHRKRPLVITADRGRGKSSALGMAASEIIADSAKTIIVTAPNTKAVTTLFEHARKREASGQSVGFTIKNELGGRVQFVAPDELLSTKPECDLLLVDEASALPLPLLEKMVEHYHRVCFATTVHGYEGCGRGFTLKFESWLSVNRPGWKALRLTQPIRWSPEDPLEAWLFDTFLLDAEIEPCNVNQEHDLVFEAVYQPQLLNQTGILRDCFGLLVNAHYQTSPNDLFQLLDDEKLTLFRVTQGGRCIAVVLASQEGELAPSLVADIQCGKRRPAGHLVPVALCNHLAIDSPALLSSLRVMRIAVHPDRQGEGVGSWVLKQLQSYAQSKFDYISTSFGATADLVRFWLSNDFVPVRLGSKQDQASGCYSAVMIKAVDDELEWLAPARSLFVKQLLDTLFDVHINLSSQLVFEFVRSYSNEYDSPTVLDERLVRNYVHGGNAFDTSRASVRAILLSKVVLIAKHGFSTELDLIICVALKRMNWHKLSEKFGFTGRKQAEQAYREAVKNLLL